MNLTTMEIIKKYEKSIDSEVDRRLKGLPPFLDKDDLVQEVNTYLIKTLPDWDPTRASIATYVDRMTRFAIQNYLTEVNVVQAEDIDLYQPSYEEVEETVEDIVKEYGQDEIERFILTGTAYGMTQTEIGEELGITQQTVSRTLNRIKKRNT